MLSLAGCGPTVGGADSTSTESSSSAETTTTTASTTTTSADVTSTGGDDTTTSTTSESTTTDGDTTTTGGPPPSVCDPQPQFVDAELDFDPGAESEDYFVDATCTVSELVPGDEHSMYIALDCDVDGAIEQHGVSVYADPWVEIPIAVDDVVGLRAAESVPIDTGGYEFVVLRDAQGELLAAMHGAHVAPEVVDEVSWFDPFTWILRTDVCELEPYAPVGDAGDFIVDPCPTQDQRAAYEFFLYDESVLVFDSTRVPFGVFDLVVPYAEVHFPQAGDCEPEPFTTARFVILRRP